MFTKTHHCPSYGHLFEGLQITGKYHFIVLRFNQSIQIVSKDEKCTLCWGFIIDAYNYSWLLVLEGVKMAVAKFKIGLFESDDCVKFHIFKQ